MSTQPTESLYNPDYLDSLSPADQYKATICIGHLLAGFSGKDLALLAIQKAGLEAVYQDALETITDSGQISAQIITELEGNPKDHDLSTMNGRMIQFYETLAGYADEWQGKTIADYIDPKLMPKG